MSKLLINSNPLMVIPELAKTIGLNEAIFIQQLHYWLEHYREPKSCSTMSEWDHHHQDGRTWIYNTNSDWIENFPFWSRETIKRIIKSLKDKKLILVGNFNKTKYDKTNWYTIDYDVFEEVEKEVFRIQEEKRQKEIANRREKEEKKELFRVALGSNPHENSSAQNELMHSSKCANAQLNLSQPIPETTTETTTKNLSFLLSDFKKSSDAFQPIEKVEKQIKEDTYYSDTKKAYNTDTKLIDEIYDNILDMYYSDKVKIEGCYKPQEIIRRQISKLSQNHVVHIMNNFKEYPNKIINNASFLKSTIYKATLDLNADSQNGLRM